MKPRKGEFGDMEWAILKVCYDKGTTTVRAIQEELNKGKYHSYMTVKNIMDRLTDKKFLQREKLGPIYLYTPGQTEKSIITSAIDDFIDTVLDNSVEPLFSHIAKNRKKYHIDVDEIKKSLESIEE